MNTLNLVTERIIVTRVLFYLCDSEGIQKKKKSVENTIKGAYNFQSKHFFGNTVIKMKKNKHFFTSLI